MQYLSIFRLEVSTIFISGELLFNVFTVKNPQFYQPNFENITPHSTFIELPAQYRNQPLKLRPFKGENDHPTVNQRVKQQLRHTPDDQIDPASIPEHNLGHRNEPQHEEHTYSKVPRVATAKSEEAQTAQREWHHCHRIEQLEKVLHGDCYGARCRQ